MSINASRASENSSDEMASEHKNAVVTLSNDDGEPVVLHGSDPNDPHDPRNWSAWRKHFVFFALMSSSLLADGYVYLHVLCKPRAHQVD